MTRQSVSAQSRVAYIRAAHAPTNFLHPTTTWPAKMRFVSAATLLALAGLAYADDSSDVISLTSSNFLSVVNKESLMLVEFFAPWLVIAVFASAGHLSSQLLFFFFLKVRALQEFGSPV